MRRSVLKLLELSTHDDNYNIDIGVILKHCIVSVGFPIVISGFVKC